MNVLVVEPGRLPYEKNVRDELENLQAIVGGNIQAIYPFEERVALVCNEDRVHNSLEFNRAIPERGYGEIYGTFFLCGLGDGDFVSLTPEQMKTYKRRFGKIEKPLAIDGTRRIPGPTVMAVSSLFPKSAKRPVKKHKR